MKYLNNKKFLIISCEFGLKMSRRVIKKGKVQKLLQALISKASEIIHD